MSCPAAGSSPDLYAVLVVNTSTIRYRRLTRSSVFWEANDLIVKAWTEEGPFTWQGKHFYVPNVNVWPRPVQKPHPPVWLPGMGSLEDDPQLREKQVHLHDDFFA